MSSKLFLLCLLLVTVSATRQYYGSSDYSPLEFRNFRDGLAEMNFGFKSRARRSGVACGAKVWNMVIRVCDGECNSTTEENIATKCCDSRCDDNYIRNVCCKQ